ncbi:ATP-grasp domain-containing protein [Congregibacter brevis]|uniref:ATP-grasp domain-containing protein n=1 Tax=Congregibacter brevis TaxID=3081201 RepID=A0ABZ0IB95_9GAMM|nr:ATP-grasp domain-containing protein [Congregibacter sp. IMCC45268]
MRALLVDTGFSAEPLLHAATAAGFDVSVVGNRPDDVLTHIASDYIQSDYSRTPLLRKSFVESHSDALIPGCTDISYLSSSSLRDEPGVRNIDSFDQSQMIFDKAKFRSLCHELDVPSPQSYENLEAIEVGSKVIVKPVDAYSGRGISVIHFNDEAELARAVSHAKASSPSNSFLVEDFVEGYLYSSSLFMKRGKVARAFLVEEHCCSGSYSVSLSRVIDDTPGSKRREVEAAMELISQHLDLCDGLMHVQWIEGPDGFKLIELTRRCPGDLYARLIELSTGFDYAGAYVAPFLGQSLSRQATTEDSIPNTLRVTVKGPPKSMLTQLEISDSHRVVEYYPLINIGEEIDESGRVGILFLALDATYHSKALGEGWEDSLYEVSSVKP